MFFKKQKKAQTGVIAYLIVAGIIVFTTGIAYNWGSPMLEKSTADSNIYLAQNTLKKIGVEITKIGGQSNIDFDIKGDFKIDEKTNSIYYLLEIPATMASSKEWIPISASNMWGVYDTPESDTAGRLGVDEPCVLLARSTQTGDNDKYAVTFRLAFRELDDFVAGGGTKIQLEITGNKITSSGSHSLLIKKGEPYTSQIESVYGGDLIIVPIQLILN